MGIGKIVKHTHHVGICSRNGISIRTEPVL
jgi:hypothetical protein